MKIPFLRYLARRQQSGATGTPPKEPACPFPNCGAAFVPIKGKPDVCDYHRKLIEDVTYILAHLRQVEGRPKGPDLVVPPSVIRKAG